MYNNNENKYRVIFEGITYLLENEKFSEEVDKIRKKYKIIAPILRKNFTSGVIPMPNFDVLEYYADIAMLGQRCLLYKSKFRGIFLTMLQNYVLTGKLTRPFVKVQTAPPAIQIFIENTRPVLKMYLDFDTERKDINQSIRENWNKIKAIQEEAVGKKIGDSKYLNSKIKLWRLRKIDKKNPKEILEMITNGKITNPPEESWSEKGLTRIIDRTNLQIQKAFI